MLHSASFSWIYDTRADYVAFLNILLILYLFICLDILQAYEKYKNSFLHSVYSPEQPFQPRSNAS